MPVGAGPGAPQERMAERALVLTVATFFLLTPPLLAIFDVPVLVFGIPLLHVYCFVTWLAAIGLGGLLARRMAGEPGPPEPPPGRG
jgi:hypothetical protein